jgi:hypothetical protein
MDHGEIDRSRYMGGWEELSTSRTRAVLFVVNFVKYYIMTCRNGRRFPLLYQLKIEYEAAVKYLQKNEIWRTELANLQNVLTNIFVLDEA